MRQQQRNSNSKKTPIQQALHFNSPLGDRGNFPFGGFRGPFLLSHLSFQKVPRRVLLLLRLSLSKSSQASLCTRCFNLTTSMRCRTRRLSGRSFPLIGSFHYIFLTNYQRYPKPGSKTSCKSSRDRRRVLQPGDL